MSSRLQNKKYKIDYNSNKIYIGMTIIGIINEYIGDENNAFVLNLDSTNIFDQEDKKIEGYQDYKIGVIPGDNKFLKKDRALKLSGFKHTRCNGCSTWITKKKNTIHKNDELIHEKPFYPEDTDQFKICIDKTQEMKLIPIKIVGTVVNLDTVNKYIDIHISNFYELSNYC